MKPMNKNTKNSCINDFDPSALDEVTAVKQILKSIAKIKESETINIMDSLGRVSSKILNHRSIYHLLGILRWMGMLLISKI